MRMCNIAGRLNTFVDGKAVDVAAATDNRFSSDPQRMFDDWQALVDWGASINARGSGDVDLAQVEAPVPRPAQVFAIGLNYRAHAEEGIFSVPEEPTVFTKWPSCIVGPSHDVELPVDTDWEVELVVAISRRARTLPDRRQRSIHWRRMNQASTATAIRTQKATTPQNAKCDWA